jgi:DNA-binding NtrC family response regulator
MRQVLVIDDDSSVCQMITKTLQEWPDTNVICAQNGIEGAEMLRERHFDLALIDGFLSGLSSIQLAEIAASESTPVLLLSSHPDVNRRQRRSAFHICPSRFRSASY